MNVTVRGRTQHHRTVAFDCARNSVLLIEQRLLPHEFKIIATKNYRETTRAITDMIVRGKQSVDTGAQGFVRAAFAVEKFSALAGGFCQCQLEQEFFAV